MSTKNKSVKNPPNTKTITDYFQLKKRIEFVDVPVVNSTISESFYDECLDLQLNQNKCSENCQSWKLELKNRLLVERNKLQNIEKALSSCLFIIDIKKEKIAQLMKAHETTTASNTVNSTNVVPKSVNTMKNIPMLQKSPRLSLKNPVELFKNHENHFTTIELAKLRSFNGEMRQDSTFILNAMRFLFNDISELESMS